MGVTERLFTFLHEWPAYKQSDSSTYHRIVVMEHHKLLVFRQEDVELKTIRICAQQAPKPLQCILLEDCRVSSMSDHKGFVFSGEQMIAG